MPPYIYIYYVVYTYKSNICLYIIFTFFKFNYGFTPISFFPLFQCQSIYLLPFKFMTFSSLTNEAR